MFERINKYFETVTYIRIFRLYLAVIIILFIVAWSNPNNAIITIGW